MTAFNESNTVEAYFRDLLAGPVKSSPGQVQAPFSIQLGVSHKGTGWYYAAPSQVPRQIQEVFVESWLRDALIRLNPEIAEQPERADEVLYRLRAIVLSVRSDGLIRANEEMTAWMRGERSMPFGPNHEHVPIRLLDLEDVSENQYVVTQQYTYRAGSNERRADLVLLVNGLPLLLIEAKTPVKTCVSWVDGAIQVHDDYERFVPELFVCNVFSVATEGKEYHFGSIGMPVKDWGPWHLDDGESQHHPFRTLKFSVESMLQPHVVLDILGSFTLFATDKQKRRSKIICRYQQYEAVNKIVERVVAGYPKKGLIWHFQGSGKSLLMVFAAQKLRMHPMLKNPTVLIVVDRVDLDTQITGTFTSTDIPNLEKAETREKLQQLLAQDTRKIIITTIFKFGEVNDCLNSRSNIIALVDEAHRTQEGDLGRKMREALPNAFLFGLTGTPINRADRNPNQSVSRCSLLTISIRERSFMEYQKPEGNAPSLVVPAQSLAPSSSKALELASSLIDTTGTGGDATRDEIVSLPVDRPGKTQFFRIHPELHADVNILKVDGLNGTEKYAVVPAMVKSLDNVGLYTLFFGVHRDGSYFLWPVSATSSDGYSRSARQIAVAAMQQWCRLVSNRATSVYIKRVAPNCEDIPVWPDEKTFADLLVLAFGDGHIIDSPEHPVVKEMWLK